MAIRKTFSFTDSRVVEWIDKEGGSKYISRLVLEDMERMNKVFVTRDEVVRIVEERMGSRNFVVDEMVKNSAVGLLNF